MHPAIFFTGLQAEFSVKLFAFFKVWDF